MGKAAGSGLLFAGIILFIMGAVLKWDLIDWLIDITGLLLIVIGVILAIVGIVQMMSGGKSGSSDY
ncbi:MAG TPA: hypothetical protein DCP37_15120 [Dehalococcoidia bacterium]|nr:hypothetical protein [Dehalococcoidia bacterium]